MSKLAITIINNPSFAYTVIVALLHLAVNISAFSNMTIPETKGWDNDARIFLSYSRPDNSLQCTSGAARILSVYHLSLLDKNDIVRRSFDFAFVPTRVRFVKRPGSQIKWERRHNFGSSIVLLEPEVGHYCRICFLFYFLTNRSVFFPYSTTTMVSTFITTAGTFLLFLEVPTTTTIFWLKRFGGIIKISKNIFSFT